MDSLITSFQTELQRARVSIGAALDCLASMPDASAASLGAQYNMAHWSIMAGVLQRVDYELHAMQNTATRKQGTFPHEVYNGHAGRAVVSDVDSETAQRLDETAFVQQFSDAMESQGGNHRE